MSLRRAFGHLLAFAGRRFRLPDPLGGSPRQKLGRATRPVVDELERRVMLTALPAFVHTSGNVVVGCNLQGDGSMLIDFWGGTASFDQNIATGGPDFAQTRIEVHDDAQLLFNAPQTLASLGLFDSAKVTDSKGNLADGHGNVLDLSSLSIGTNATLDLTDNGAILRYGIDTASEQAALATARPLLVSGYAGGSWTGTGIVSSLAASDPNHNTAVGYADNQDLGDSSFDGVTLSDLWTEVLIQYTYYGDADLSGRVDAADASLVAAGLAGDGTAGTSGTSTTPADKPTAPIRRSSSPAMACPSPTRCCRGPSLPRASCSIPPRTRPCRRTSPPSPIRCTPAFPPAITWPRSSSAACPRWPASMLIQAQPANSASAPRRPRSPIRTR